MMGVLRGLSCLLGVLLFHGGALAQIAVVVSAKAPQSSLTAEQVAQVFLGTSNEFRPVDQNDGGALRNDFYRKVADKDASQVKAVWSRLTFTGKGKPPKELASSADVKKAIADDPRVMGYVEKSAVDSTVKVLLVLP